MTPDLSWLDDVSALAVLGWVLGIVALFVLVWKAWPVIRRLVQTVDALGELPEIVGRIRAQVENDHDSNLRDELTEALGRLEKVERLIVIISPKLDRDYEAIKRQTQRLDEHLAIAGPIIAKLENKEKP